MVVRRTPTLGEEVKRFRESRGKSIRECAERTGLSPEAISAIERGDRYPSLRSLEVIAECLVIRFVIGPNETIVEIDF